MTGLDDDRIATAGDDDPARRRAWSWIAAGLVVAVAVVVIAVRLTGSAPIAHCGGDRADCLVVRHDAESSKQLAPLHGVVAGVGRSGLVEVVALDAAGRPWHVTETAIDRWSAWQPLGAELHARSLAVARDNDGRLAVLAIDDHGALDAIDELPLHGWTEWSRLRITADHVTSVLDPERRNRLYAIDAGSVVELRQDRPDQGYGEWTQVPAPPTTALVALADEHQVHLFGISRGQAWHLELGNGWSAVRLLPASAPLLSIDAARSGDGSIHVVAVDREHRAITTRVGSTEWGPLGDPEAIAVLHLLQREPVPLDATVATTTHRLLQLDQGNDSSHWNRGWEELVGAAPLDGVTDLARARDDSGSSYVIVVTLRGETWVRRFDGGTHGFHLL
ncbi:MAG TPA: hypothetical protein VGM88_12500 [Kofleriaceae bacterium]|jgi:hypothetical protein